MRARLASEQRQIAGASTFDQIAAAIEGSQSSEKGEAAVKLRNTERGVARARAYFDQQGMKDEKEAFIDQRYEGALQDQRDGITMTGSKRPALAQILAEPNEALHEADYSNLQWDAVFGANKATTLKQELLSTDDMAASVEVAKQRGGLAKLLPLSNLWSDMDSTLKSLWVQVYGSETQASSAWFAQTIAGKAPATQPSTLDNGVSAFQFRPFTDLANAFPAATSGCMGMGEDYEFSTIAEAVDKLGLRPGPYQNGAFILSIETGEVEAAAQAGGGIGKATVFTSLMFSEFNYICEDRATNETESGDLEVNKNAKQNSGEKSKGGKTEVVVTELPAANLFAKAPKLLV